MVFAGHQLLDCCFKLLPTTLNTLLTIVLFNFSVLQANNITRIKVHLDVVTFSGTELMANISPTGDTDRAACTVKPDSRTIKETIISSVSEQHRTAADRSPRSTGPIGINQKFQANPKHLSWCVELHSNPCPLFSFSSKQRFEGGGFGNRPGPKSSPQSQYRNLVQAKHTPEECFENYCRAICSDHRAFDTLASAASKGISVKTEEQENR